MRNLALLTAVTTFVSANVRAQSKPVCSLLTASDVSAIGATGQGIPGGMTIPNGPYKGQTMKMCSWRMKEGGLTLSANPMPPGTSRDALATELNKTYELLTSKGWNREKKDFGNMTCNLFTPPAGDKEAPANTSCLTVAKGTLVNAERPKQKSRTYGEAEDRRGCGDGASVTSASFRAARCEVRR